MNRTCVSTRLKVAELRDICVGMGISTEGTKKDLLRRINDFTNSSSEDDYDDFQEDEHFQSPIHHSSTEDDERFRLFREEQEIEFQESLRVDKIKSVVQAIKSETLESVSISDLKLFLDSENISCENAIEKSDLMKLIPCHTKPDSSRENTEEELESYLSKEELRQARLKFFS